jgi:hypothetical protein
VYIKNSNYWTFFHKKVKTVNSKQLTVKKKLTQMVNNPLRASKGKQLFQKFHISKINKK